METNNLTSVLPAAHKARPAAGAADSGPPTKAAVAESTNGGGLSPPLAEVVATAEPSPAKPAVELAADEKKPSQNQVQEALRKLNDLAKTSIAFSQHEETGQTVIKVSDKDTGEEIRTIPSEDFLAIAAHLQETLDSDDGLKPGLLVSSQA